jgi:hypothetical protein
MLSFIEKRKNRRFPSIAKAKLPAVFTGEALLKDISVTGCRIECTMQVEIHENAEYSITIFPEDSAGINSFDILAECIWFHSSGYSCEIGFAVKSSPGKRNFERYVDYLSWRSNT